MNHLHRTVLWLFVAVMLESLVAVVLRIGSVTAFLDGDRSGLELVALAGLGALALLLVVTVGTVRTLLGMWHQITKADSRIAVLETSAMMSQAQVLGRLSPVPADFGRDVEAARQRVLNLLDRGNLTVAMQPIINLEQDRWVAVEALARFPDGRGPEVWFREAQELGLGVALELVSVTLALGRANDLPPDIGVSINVSPSLILDPRLAEAINQSGIALDRLTLEITEHAAVTQYDEIKAALLVLRERGLLLAVDDTGAGYASFSHVLQLRPDVKLDRSMVASIADDPAKRAFVTVVGLGVDHAQGYYLGRPDTSAATWQSWAGRRWLSPTEVRPTELHLDA